MNFKQTSTHSDFHISIRHFGTFPLNENQLSSVEFVTTNVSWLFGNWFDCTVLYCNVQSNRLRCVELTVNEFPRCQQYSVMWNERYFVMWSDYEIIAIAIVFDLIALNSYPNQTTNSWWHIYMISYVAIILTEKQRFNFLSVSVSLFWLFFNFFGAYYKMVRPS